MAYTPEQIARFERMAREHVAQLSGSRAAAQLRSAMLERPSAPGPASPRDLPSCIFALMPGERVLVSDGLFYGWGSAVGGASCLRDPSSRAPDATDGEAAAPLFGARANLLPDPGVVTWASSGGAPTITGGQADPVGGANAWAIGDANATGHSSAACTVGAYVPGTPIRGEIWIKQGGTAFAQLQLAFNSVYNVHSIAFDPRDGMISIIGGAFTSASAELLDGWWFVTFTHPGDVGTDVRLRIHPAIGTSIPTQNIAATGTAVVYAPSIRYANGGLVLPAIESIIGAGDFHLMALTLPVSNGDATILDHDSGALTLEIVGGKYRATLATESGPVTAEAPGDAADAVLTVTVIELEQRRGTLTLRAGAAGKASVDVPTSRSVPAGTLRAGWNGDLAAGGARCALLALMGFSSPLSLVDARRLRAWVLENFGDVAPLAEW